MSQSLPREAWQTYCDRISKGLANERAELEVISLELGDQIPDEWVALQGLVYDPKSDVFEIVLEGLDHLINHPREVYVDEGPTGLEMMEILGGDGTKQILKLKRPLTLPAPD